MRTFESIQRQTFEEMCACLEEHGLCCVERPTGFGKTKLFMDYVKQYPNDRFLYIYDVNSALSDIKSKYNPENVEFLSYTAISREDSFAKTKQFLVSQPWHTIIFDEAHLMGGDNIMKVLLDIIPLAVASGVRILGGTATKLRTDLIDVSQRFFKGYGVSEYTMMDAVNDGIMQAPVWTLTAHYKELLHALRKAVGNKPNSFVSESLQSLNRAYATIDGVGSVYAQTVKDVYGEIPDLMRFIVFYPTIKSLNDNLDRDVADFQKAFPSHTVVPAALSTDSSHMSTVTDVEEIFTSEGKQVQLIFAVDMLNQSYHSNLLTGIVMYRASYSNIIFTQQLGRIMSVTSEKPGIVFDNVGNALIRPERAMAALQSMLEDNKVPSGVSVPKGHINIRLRATQEFVEFQKVYQRIMATQQITQEQINFAKFLVHDQKAPIELVMQGLRLSEENARCLVSG